MILRRAAPGCVVIGLLPVIGLVVLAAWGAILLVTAHPVHPISTTGVVAEAADSYEGNTYQDTRVTLQGDGRNYRVYLPNLQPPIAADRPKAGERITLWFDPNTNWVDLTETRVLAISLGDEPADRGAHRLDDFDHPESAAMRQRLVGAGLLGLVALIIGLSALWERFFDRRQRDLLIAPRG